MTSCQSGRAKDLRGMTKIRHKPQSTRRQVSRQRGRLHNDHSLVETIGPRRWLFNNQFRLDYSDPSGYCVAVLAPACAAAGVATGIITGTAVAIGSGFVVVVGGLVAAVRSPAGEANWTALPTGSWEVIRNRAPGSALIVEHHRTAELRRSIWRPGWREGHNNAARRNESYTEWCETSPSIVDKRGTS